MAQDIRDFTWFVLDPNDDVIAMFELECDANGFATVKNKKEHGEGHRVQEGYFNFDASCTVST